MSTETENPDPKRWLAPFLKKLGVTEFEANLSGYGDSGEITDITYLSEGRALENDAVEGALSALSVDDGSARPKTFLDVFHEMIEEDAADAGDYYNNEGGSVWSSYVIDADTGEIELEIASYTANEPDYDEDDEEEWDPFEEDEEEDPDDVEP